MSQFIFGEILLSKTSEVLLPASLDLSVYPFSFRFKLHQHDYFQRISGDDYGGLPFVVTDSPIDNTAELILRNDSVEYAEGTLPACYDLLLSKTLSERISLLVSALTEALSILDSHECILVLSDGTGIPDEQFDCYMSDLHKEIIELFLHDQSFVTGYYRVHK